MSWYLPAYRIQCDVCGRWFVSSNGRKKRCSPECDEAAKKLIAANWDKVKHERVLERKRRRNRDGVSESVRQKVLEAMRLGCSYGKLQTIRALEAAEQKRRKAVK